MPLTTSADLAVAGGTYRRLPVEINANPFTGSLLSYAPDGFAHELVAGEPFAGVCAQTIETDKVATADGSRTVDAITGDFAITVTIATVTQDDAARRRRVFASDDGTFTLLPANNTAIGVVIGVDGSKATVLCRTADLIQAPSGPLGHRVLADAAATLTEQQLDCLLVITPTAGRTLTLPPAARCAGRTYQVSVQAAFAITFDGDGAETVNGAATWATAATAGVTARLYSTGTAWVSA